MKLLKTIKAIAGGGRDLKCEACGNEFVCGASLKGCWCSEVPLNKDDRSTLKAKFSDCLCKDCLEKQAGTTKEWENTRASS